MTSKCMYKQLPGDCTTAASLIFPDLCAGHVSHVFGIGQAVIYLPSGVSRSLSSEFYSTSSLGVTLVAQWSGRNNCEDVVFHENDTVLAFSEYLTSALSSDECLKTGAANVKINSSESLAKLAQQREFSRVLSEARFAAICASLFPIGDNCRETFAAIAATQFASVRRLAKPAQYTDIELLSRKALYVNSHFRLSKPITTYVRRLHALGTEGSYEPMVWDTFRNSTARPSLLSTIGIGELDFFRTHNASNMLLGQFDTLRCRSTNETQATVISEKLYAIARAIHVRYLPNYSALKRYSRRPLLNQYDDSKLGHCNGYFMSTFAELYSARTLAVICMLCLPLSTIKKPSGTVSEIEYQEYYCDKFLFDKNSTPDEGNNKKIGLNKATEFVYFARAFATLDNEISREDPVNSPEFTPSELNEFTQKLSGNYDADNEMEYEGEEAENENDNTVDGAQSKSSLSDVAQSSSPNISPQRSPPNTRKRKNLNA